MMMPSQIDTCTPELIRDAYDYAVERRLPLQIHASQSVTEFHEMVRRHGKTPIGWLTPSVRSAATPSSGTASSSTTTLAALADAWRHAAAAGHRRHRRALPDRFMRRGIAMNTFGAYARQASISGSARTPTRTISSRRCAAPSPSRGRLRARSTT